MTTVYVLISLCWDGDVSFCGIFTRITGAVFNFSADSCNSNVTIITEDPAIFSITTYLLLKNLCAIYIAHRSLHIYLFMVEVMRNFAEIRQRNRFSKTPWNAIVNTLNFRSLTLKLIFIYHSVLRNPWLFASFEFSEFHELEESLIHSFFPEGGVGNQQANQCNCWWNYDLLTPTQARGFLDFSLMTPR